MALNGNASAQKALDLANAPDRFLSTVQIGITLVGIGAGAFGGATIAGNLSASLAALPVIGVHHQVVSLALVVLAITYLTIVLGELVPKRLAMTHPEAIAAAVAPLMRRLALIALPAVRLLSLSSNLVFRVLGIPKSTDPPVTEEEIKMLIEQGTKAGIFDETEKDIVKSVFRLADREVRILMTPRRDMVWLDLDEGGRPTIAKSWRAPSPAFRWPRGVWTTCWASSGRKTPWPIVCRNGVWT